MGEYTTYHFKVSAPHLEGALDRFAPFFVGPPSLAQSAMVSANALAGALLGIIGVHLLGDIALPVRSSWGWSPSKDMEASSEWSCKKGTGTGCNMVCSQQDLMCDVVPEEGYTCDVSTTQLMCYQDATPDVIFDPSVVHGKEGCKNKANKATLIWVPPPSCSKTTSKSKSRLVLSRRSVKPDIAQDDVAQFLQLGAEREERTAGEDEL